MTYYGDALTAVTMAEAEHESTLTRLADTVATLAEVRVLHTESRQRVLDLEAENAALRARLAELEPVPVTLRGVSYKQQPNTNEQLYAGRAQVARIFLQNLDGRSWGNVGQIARAESHGVKVFVVSWKDTSAARVGAFLSTIPDGVTVYGSYHHEPENDGQFLTPLLWQARWQEQAPVMRAHGVIPTPIRMAGTLYGVKGRNIADWVLPDGVADVCGFDAYYEDRDPADLAARVLAHAEQEGRPLLIAETGDYADSPTRPAKSATFYGALEGRAIAVCYWNSATVDHDFTLDPATIDVVLPA